MAGAQRPSKRARSLFPLRRVQCRQLSRAALVSDLVRAGFYAAHAGTAVERRLRAAGRCHRHLRRSAAARARRRNRAARGSGRAETALAHHRALGFRLGGAVGPAGRDHRAHIDRRRRRAIAVGDAAIDLPADLGDGVRAAAAVLARPHPDHAALRHRRHRRAAAGGRKHPAAAEPHRASAGVLRHRHGLSRRIGTQPAGGGASDDVLSRALVRRHAGRAVRRTGRAQYFLLGGRISDLGRVGGAVPADGRRASAAGATLAGRDAAMGPSATRLLAGGNCHRLRADRAGVLRRAYHRKNGAGAAGAGVDAGGHLDRLHARPAQIGVHRHGGIGGDPALPARRKPRRNRAQLFRRQSYL